MNKILRLIFLVSLFVFSALLFWGSVSALSVSSVNIYLVFNVAISLFLVYSAIMIVLDNEQAYTLLNTVLVGFYVFTFVNALQNGVDFSLNNLNLILLFSIPIALGLLVKLLQTKLSSFWHKLVFSFFLLLLMILLVLFFDLFVVNWFNLKISLINIIISIVN